MAIHGEISNTKQCSSSLINQNAPWEDVDVCGALERPGEITIQFYKNAANILKFPVIF